MRFHSQDDYIHRACISNFADDFGAHLEIALRAEDSETMLLHRAQVRTARKKRDLLAGAGHPCAYVAADSSGARNQEPHCLCRRKRLGHRAALDLAGCRARDRVGDVDFLGAFEVRQALLAERQNIRFARRLL